MKFIVNYTLEDYIAAQKLHLRSSKSGWLIRWLFPFIGGGTLIALASRYVAGLPPPTFQTFYFGILGIFFLFFPILIIQISTRTLFKKSKFLHVPSEFEINEEEVKITNELNSGTIKWPLFIRYGVNGQMLILMSTPRTMMMIPKRFVSSEEEWNELLRLAKEKVQKS